jgi:MmgE/PrpD N-terminal domain
MCWSAQDDEGEPEERKAVMSLSREFAQFVADLDFGDLPAAVVDRAKGVTLQALASAVVAHDMPASRQALAMMQEEETGGGGAGTVLCRGAKLSKSGAAFVNTETIFAGGKWDTFRMLTHPGTAIIPAALAAAEATDASGPAFLTAIAAGYEVMERMAAEFIPTVMARGFHAGPVFGIFGAAVAAAKLGRLDANQVNGAIAQCVNLAAGNLEGARSGGQSLREGGAVRNALLAVALAKHGMPGGETTLEGEAGFYHAYAGSNRGELRYSFTGANRADLAAITRGLGRDWQFLETLYRIYSTAGYNIAHVDVTAKLCEEHDIAAADIDRIEALVNWLETEYPSPAFPSRGIESPPQVGSTQYFTAWGAAERGYPLLRGSQPGPGETDPPAVLDLMRRVTLIPTVRRTLFGPRITVFTKDGRSFTKEGSGREFIWDFEEEARRIRPMAAGLAIGEAQFAELIDTCRHLDHIDHAARRLIALTIPD